MRADQIRAERKKPRCITPPRTGRTRAMPKISPFEKYAAQYEKLIWPSIRPSLRVYPGPREMNLLNPVTVKDLLWLYAAGKKKLE